MTQIARQTTWASLQTLTASALNGEFNNIINSWNNHDAGSSSWTKVYGGTIKATTQLLGVGTSTNDDAASTYIGEYIESIVASGTSVAGSSGHFSDATNIVLTAGDWDLEGVIDIARNSATFSSVHMVIGIGTTSGDSSAGLTTGSTRFDMDAVIPTSFTEATLVMPRTRFSLSSTTTKYLKLFLDSFSAATPQYGCRFSARRVR